MSAPFEDDPISPLPEDLLELAREYGTAKRVPAAEMWLNIAKELEGRPRRAIRGGGRIGVWGTLGWLAAASIVLAVGVGIGRVTDAGPSVAGGSGRVQVTSPVSTSSSRAVAVQEIDALEPLLSMVASDARSGSFDPQVGAWAERVLVKTRLLQDASTSDPALEALLQDLELVLMQIASLEGMDAERGQEELALIAQGLQSNNMMGRIRSIAALGP